MEGQEWNWGFFVIIKKKNIRKKGEVGGVFDGKSEIEGGGYIYVYVGYGCGLGLGLGLGLGFGVWGVRKVENVVN